MMFYMSSNARAYALQRSVREPHGAPSRLAWQSRVRRFAPHACGVEDILFYESAQLELPLAPGPSFYRGVCPGGSPRCLFTGTVYNKDKDWGHVRCVYSERAVTVP